MSEPTKPDPKKPDTEKPNPDQLEEIFSQAIQLPDDAERMRYVDQACRGNAQLARQVSSLLRSARESDTFLETPVRRSEPADAPKSSPPEQDRSASSAEFPFLKPPTVSNDLGTLGPYRILNRVGRGGMGIVFRAIDPKLRRVVAVKVLAPEIAIDPMARKRFEREARSAAAVSHPNVVVIHAVDEMHTPPYLVMEFIQGKTLADKLATKGALSVKEILRIGGQVAAALAAAHKQGLVHRDVKPANILLENGIERAKVTDFGLAKTVDDMGMTRTGDLSGTPQFMSPEQASGGRIDHRTDLFSLGAVLYAMCTGKPPFRASHPLALLKQVCENSPAPIQQINPQMPLWLSTIVDRLLEKSPANRYQTATEVAVLLQKHLARKQRGPSTGLPAKEPRFKRLRIIWQQRRRSVLAFILLVGVGTAAWAIGQRLFSFVERSTTRVQGVTTQAVAESRFEPVQAVDQRPTVVNQPIVATQDPGVVQGDDYISPGTGMKFKRIPAGQGVYGIRPRSISVDDAYYLAVFTVTQSQWHTVMGTKPWAGEAEDPDLPVGVTWPETQEFCRKLGKLDNIPYRLPSDLEWEYACRAGATTSYHFGDSPRDLPNYAWFKDNTVDVGQSYPHKVGQKLPNDWGLFDMHGNIGQWCNDLGPGEDTKRVIRGAGFARDAATCIAGHRRVIWPWNRGGFRVAFTPVKAISNNDRKAE